MAHLSYSFCMSMLHSLWQAGLLLLVYILHENILQTKISPLQKRNILFILVISQLSFFLITFLIYFLQIENNVSGNFLNKSVSDILAPDLINSITRWLFAVYFIVIIFKIIKAVHGWYHFKKLYYKGLLKPTIDLKLFTLLKANHFGIKRKVQLWFSKTINTPVTFGFLKPVIVLPVALLNQLTLQQAETLILHELTHIKANDYLFNWIILIVENVFFFNPFVLILCADIRLEREKYCDSNVMAFEYSPLLYAETLLQTQNYQQYIPLHQMAAVNGKTQLFKRIQFFTNTNNLTHQKRNKVILPIFSTLVILVFGTTIFFQYQIATKPKIDEPTTFAPFYENTIELNTPAFVNNILENLTDDKLKLIEATAEKQKPVFEKQLKKLEPLLQSIQNRAEIITKEINENFVTPVAFKENDATRQIIIKEEQSGSKNATVKVFTVSFINGEWVVIPEWMLASKEINMDTLLKKIDTSYIKKNPF